MFYIRSGYALEQVKFLGRWKSDVVLEYAAEALEERPALADKAKGVGKRRADENLTDNAATLERHTKLFKEMKEANEEFKTKLQENFNRYVDIMKQEEQAKGTPDQGLRAVLQEGVQRLQRLDPRHRHEHDEGNPSPVENKVRMALRLLQLHLRY